MHWVQTAPGPEAATYRDRIAAHFRARQAAGGNWIDAYAAKVYPFEDAAAPGGLEVPTVYFEKLADPRKSAEAFNDDAATMLEVLSIFFP